MKNLLFILSIVTCISCDSIALTGIGANLCLTKINYHTSSNCDDSVRIADGFSSTAIIEIKAALKESEIGECVLVDFNGMIDSETGNSVLSGYIINDADNSWLVKDCN